MKDSFAILVCFHKWFASLWLSLTVLLLVWKRNRLMYTPSVYGWEVAMVIFTSLIDLARLQLITKGNMTGKPIPIVWSCGLSIPVIIGFTFGLRLQSYILYLDMILNTIGLGFVVIEVLIQLPFLIGIMLGGTSFIKHSSISGGDHQYSFNRPCGFDCKKWGKRFN